MVTKTDPRENSSITRWVLYVAVAAAMVATLLSAGLVARTPAPAGSSLPAQTYTHRDIIAIVHAELGDAWQRQVPKVQGVMVNESPDGYLVQVRFTIDDSGTPALTSAGAREDVRRVMRALYQEAVPVALVQMEGTLAIADPNGFVRETSVLKGALGLPTARKINWDRVDGAGLFSSLDLLWWHDALAGS